MSTRRIDFPYTRLSGAIARPLGIRLEPDELRATVAARGEDCRCGGLLPLVSRRLRAAGAGAGAVPARPLNVASERAAFVRVRDAIAATLRVPPRRIRPSTPLASLVPWRHRRRQWKRLKAALGQNLALSSPDAVWRILPVLLAVFPGGIAGLYLFVELILRPLGRWQPAEWARPLVALPLFVLGMTVFLLVTTAFMVVAAAPFEWYLSHRPPGGCARVRDLARRVAADDGRFRVPLAPTPPAVWFVLRRALADDAGVEPRQVRRDTRLLADLGLPPPTCACGYDLRGNRSGHCPECGCATYSPELDDGDVLFIAPDAGPRADAGDAAGLVSAIN